MIRFFRASRMTAMWGSAAGAFAGAAAAWAFYPGDRGTKAVLALVAAALAVNVCLYSDLGIRQCSCSDRQIF